jgi:hypothetical protein
MKIPPSKKGMELQRVGKVVYGVYVRSVEMFSLIRKERGGGMRMLALSIVAFSERMRWR